MRFAQALALQHSCMRANHVVIGFLCADEFWGAAPVQHMRPAFMTNRIKTEPAGCIFDGLGKGEIFPDPAS